MMSHSLIKGRRQQNLLVNEVGGGLSGFFFKGEKDAE